MEEVRENIYRIDLPRPDLPPHLLASPAEPIGCHVVDGAERVLFGTGYAFSTDQLLDGLAALGGIDVVVVEHDDTDHYGALPGVVEAYDPRVAVPADDRVGIHRVYRDVPPDVLLEDSDRIGGFRALTVRGHTYGNMAFVDERAGVLVAGDTVVASDSDIAEPGPWRGRLAPPADRFNLHTEHAQRNLTALAHYDFDTALLTHGDDVLERADEEFLVLLADLGLHWEL